MFGKEKVPVNNDEFSRVFLENFHHFVNLQNIVMSIEHPQGIGSYLMNGTSLDYFPGMYDKQKLLYDATKGKSKCIEIGVNAGHSLLIMLIANPTALYDVIDICDRQYTKPCVQYLQQAFPNRIIAYYDDSLSVLESFRDKGYDLLHVDGCHHTSHVVRELDILRKLAIEKPTIVIDDVNPQSAEVKHALDLYKSYSVTVEHPSCMYPNTVLYIQ